MGSHRWPRPAASQPSRRSVASTRRPSKIGQKKAKNVARIGLGAQPEAIVDGSPKIKRRSRLRRCRPRRCSNAWRQNRRRPGLQTPSPYCGGDLTEPREFNLMFETYTGALQTRKNKAFLRPETAQGIFVNFKNVLDSTRVKVPFGIAQIGKSFRNEITPRNFTFRSREFEQMEIEFFCHPASSPEWYAVLARAAVPVVRRPGAGRRPAAAARPRARGAEPLLLRHGRHRVRLPLPGRGRVRRAGGRGPSRRLRPAEPHGGQAGQGAGPRRPRAGRRAATSTASPSTAAAART